MASSRDDQKVIKFSGDTKDLEKAAERVQFATEEVEAAEAHLADTQRKRANAALAYASEEDKAKKKTLKATLDIIKAEEQWAKTNASLFNKQLKGAKAYQAQIEKTNKEITQGVTASKQSGSGIDDLMGKWGKAAGILTFFVGIFAGFIAVLQKATKATQDNDQASGRSLANIQRLNNSFDKIKKALQPLIDALIKLSIEGIGKVASIIEFTMPLINLMIKGFQKVVETVTYVHMTISAATLAIQAFAKATKDFISKGGGDWNDYKTSVQGAVKAIGDAESAQNRKAKSDQQYAKLAKERLEILEKEKKLLEESDASEKRLQDRREQDRKKRAEQLAQEAKQAEELRKQTQHAQAIAELDLSKHMERMTKIEADFQEKVRIIKESSLSENLKNAQIERASFERSEQWKDELANKDKQRAKQAEEQAKMLSDLRKKAAKDEAESYAKGLDRSLEKAAMETDDPLLKRQLELERELASIRLSGIDAASQAHAVYMANKNAEIELQELQIQIEESRSQAIQEGINKTNSAMKSGLGVATALGLESQAAAKAEAVVEGGIETARSIAAFASGNIIGGIGHASAAAQFFSVAGKGTPAKSVASQAPQRMQTQPTSQASQNGSGTIVYNLNVETVTGIDDRSARAIQQAVVGAESQISNPRMRRK